MCARCSFNRSFQILWSGIVEDWYKLSVYFRGTPSGLKLYCIVLKNIPTKMSEYILRKEVIGSFLINGRFLANHYDLALCVGNDTRVVVLEVCGLNLISIGH